jgi:hypothetical protein
VKLCQDCGYKPAVASTLGGSLRCEDCIRPLPRWGSKVRGSAAVETAARLRDGRACPGRDAEPGAPHIYENRHCVFCLNGQEVS